MRRRKPTWVEYTRLDKAIWKVEDWTSFVNTFEIEKSDMTEFDTWAQQYPVPWLNARMHFGINPLIPDTNTDIDSLGALPIADVAEKLGTNTDSVEYNIELLKINWYRYRKTREEPAPEPESKPPPLSESDKQQANLPLQKPPEPKKKATPADLESVLKQFGFHSGMFDVPGRTSDIERIEEMIWFTERLQELQKVFEEPMGKTLARQAIMNELQLRRADDVLTTMPIASSNFWNTYDKKVKMEAAYSKQWAQLEDMFPWVKSVAQKKVFNAMVSELIKAHQAFKANGDNTLIDGVFTGSEMQIMTRASIQQGPLYRPGWILAVKEAKDNLHNPNYKRALPDTFFKVMDDGFRKAFESAVESKLVQLVDLEADGPAGEWPPLFKPGDATAPAIPEVQDGLDIEPPDHQAKLED